MLRRVALALLLANAAYFVWTQGWLAPLGWGPVPPQREPQRLAEQIAPEGVRLLNGPARAAPVASAATPLPLPPEPGAAVPVAPPPASAPGSGAPPAATGAAEATACWQVNGFSDAQVELLRAELRLMGLGDAAALFSETRTPGRWIVYLGRFDSAELAARRKAELRAQGVEFRDVNTAGLSPGIALGTFSSEEAARQAQQQAERRGVRGSRVVRERAESTTWALRLPALTDGQRATIDGLGAAMAGRRLQACH